MAKQSVKSMRIVMGMRARINKLIDLHLSACGHDGPLAEAFAYQEKSFQWLKEKLAELESGK